MFRNTVWSARSNSSPAAPSASVSRVSTVAFAAIPSSRGSGLSHAGGDQTARRRLVVFDGGFFEHRTDPVPNEIGVLRIELDEDGGAPVAGGDHAGRTGTGERVEHRARHGVPRLAVARWAPSDRARRVGVQPSLELLAAADLANVEVVLRAAAIAEALGLRRALDHPLPRRSARRAAALRAGAGEDAPLGQLGRECGEVGAPVGLRWDLPDGSGVSR